MNEAFKYALQNLLTEKNTAIMYVLIIGLTIYLDGGITWLSWIGTSIGYAIGIGLAHLIIKGFLNNERKEQ